MTLLTLYLGVVLSGALPAASLPTAFPATTTATSAAPADAAWTAVEDARGGTGFAQALDAWLELHPRGPGASRALLEQADLRGDLAGDFHLLRKAIREGKGSTAGSAASLELARLEYACGRPASALAALDEADAWPRSEATQPQWLYWRGQSRLALKQWAPAEADFRQLTAVWPGDGHVAVAQLGAADCQAALGEDEAASASYVSLAASAGPLAAQALWGLGSLRLRQGRLDEARSAYLSLQSAYPASFEAQAAGSQLTLVASRRRQVPLASAGEGRWSVQVGAFSRRAWADKLAAHLRRRRRVRVKVRRKSIAGRVLYLVQVGPYAQRPQAAAAAELLQSKEKLPFNLVEE